MALTINDTYTGPHGANAAQIDAAFSARGTQIPKLGAAIVLQATIFGFRAEVVAGEIADETGWGTNFWSTAHNNILSVGVTGEATATPQTGPDWQITDTPEGRKWLRGYHFASVEAGLLAGLIHLGTYIYGRDKANWPASAQRYWNDVADDPRLPVLLSTTLPGTVKVIGDLGNGRFAASTTYAGSIVSRANTIAGLPHPITQQLGIPGESQAFYTWLRGKGIQVVERYIDNGWAGRGGMQPEAIVHHVTDGAGIKQAVDWWTSPGNNDPGSTHQLVAGATDPNYPDGTLMVVRRDEDQAWGNGVYESPNTALPTIARWYAQKLNPNRVTLSREHGGKPFDASFPSTKQMLTSLYCDLHWIAKYPQITPDRAHLLRHADIQRYARQNCPGPRFDLDGLIAKIVTALHNSGGEIPAIDSILQFFAAVEGGKMSLRDAWLTFIH